MAATQTPPRKNAIEVSDLVVAFGKATVLDHLSLNVRAGEILGVVGGSGAGKSVLLRTIIGLIPRRAGRITVFDVAAGESDAAWRAVERRWGILFQQGRCSPRCRCART